MDIDSEIKKLCEQKGYHFAPWEVPPWSVGVDEKCPYSPTSAGGLSWPKAQELRRQLIAEIENK